MEMSSSTRLEAILTPDLYSPHLSLQSLDRCLRQWEIAGTRYSGALQERMYKLNINGIIISL